MGDTWVTAPLNTPGTGMPLGPRSFGYHNAPGQTQRRIGAHVYIVQRYPDRIDTWRLERVGGARDCHCWRLVHRWLLAVGNPVQLDLFAVGGDPR